MNGLKDMKCKSLRNSIPKLCAFAFALVYFSLLPGQAFAHPDPWEGVFVSTNSEQAAIVSSISLKRIRQFHYLAKVHLKSFIEDSKNKSHVLQGKAQMFSSGNDKDASNRILIKFPDRQDKPLFEVFPGTKSSPVRNAGGYQTIRYTYFESTSGLYVSGELIRKP